MNQASTMAARLAACCTGAVYALLRVHGLRASTLAAGMRPPVQRPAAHVLRLQSNSISAKREVKTVSFSSNRFGLEACHPSTDVGAFVTALSLPICWTGPPGGG